MSMGPPSNVRPSQPFRMPSLPVRPLNPPQRPLFPGGVSRDNTGRVQIAAPRVEDFDDDEDDRRPKRPAAPSSGAGLFARLPKVGAVAPPPEEAYPVAKRKKPLEKPSAPSGSRVCSVDSMLEEAEIKRMQAIQSFLKKPKSAANDARQQAVVQREPAESADYLGLNSGNLEDYGAAAADDDLQWEVDASAYADDDSYTSPQDYPYEPPQPEHNLTPSGMHPPTGTVWTANYKYQDVQNIVDHPAPRAAAAAASSYQTDEQVHQLVARYEGPEFQEYLKAGNSLNIVDFRADELLGNARANVMRGLTDKALNPPPSGPVPVKGKVNSTAKRKGQITYLAAQAQARETELQNEWAKNRQTRQQASRKYGF
ncbi:proline-rich protein PRCC-like [Paramacrobiotus metropolitanus]|uniref:proline-rich protein PRCC-like n=1 Tax=Paramacrobiotus metropolitanus TaxID=2943436 RepID=UPI0024456750|nr:proline-rich protein PRCC-like [Paramacrobiotus metropolitanus]